MARTTTLLLACMVAAAAAAPTYTAPPSYHSTPPTAPGTNTTRKRSSNYAGIVNYNTGIVGASVDIIVPECHPGTPYNTYSTYTSDGWVGISAYPGSDNVKGQSYGLIQTGVSCYIFRDIDLQTGVITDSTEYRVWTEWAPAGPMFFNTTKGEIQTGDRIHGRVEAIGRDAGTTYLQNARTKKEYKHKFVNQTALLGSTNAEWVTECQTGYDPEFGFEGTYSANFTAWKFENAQYVTKDKQTFLAGPNQQIDTYINGTKVAEAVYEAPGRLQVKDTWPSTFTGAARSQ